MTRRFLMSHAHIPRGESYLQSSNEPVDVSHVVLNKASIHVGETSMPDACELVERNPYVP